MPKCPLAFDLGQDHGTRSKKAEPINKLQRHATDIRDGLDTDPISPTAIPPSPKRDRQSDADQEGPDDDAEGKHKRPRRKGDQSAEAGAQQQQQKQKQQLQPQLPATTQVNANALPANTSTKQRSCEQALSETAWETAKTRLLAFHQ